VGGASIVRTVRTWPRVLIIDDDAAVRRSWELTAVARGVPLETAATSAQARALLAQRAFDIVLCDLHLDQGASGEDLIRDLYARRTRVAVVSGDPKGAVARLGLRVPVFAKPVSLDQIFAVHLVER
jgi:two-component system response regulator PilR (NtrC family)